MPWFHLQFIACNALQFFCNNCRRSNVMESVQYYCRKIAARCMHYIAHETTSDGIATIWVTVSRTCMSWPFSQYLSIGLLCIRYVESLDYARQRVDISTSPALPAWSIVVNQVQLFTSSWFIKEILT